MTSFLFLTSHLCVEFVLYTGILLVSSEDTLVLVKYVKTKLLDFLILRKFSKQIIYFSRKYCENLLLFVQTQNSVAQSQLQFRSALNCFIKGQCHKIFTRPICFFPKTNQSAWPLDENDSTIYNMADISGRY